MNKRSGWHASTYIQFFDAVKWSLNTVAQPQKLGKGRQGGEKEPESSILAADPLVKQTRKSEDYRRREETQ